MRGGQVEIDDAEPTGFMDESMRAGPNGLYVVAAVVVLADSQHAREAAQQVPPKRRRFHWRTEEEPQRRHMVKVLSELGGGLWAYTCQPCPTARWERGRAKCLEKLLWDLNHLGVDQLVVESRGAHADPKDRQTILHAQQTGVAAKELRYEHRPGTDDPALWLADGLAGAVAAAACGDRRYVTGLSAGFTPTTVDL